uniref:Calmodulin n=1 Tax=Tetraselmis sp. GSL018 TaxID=582737 RepID=A0A061RWF7_9CHLO|eukprot:CAMPEP_0177617168 /NCGR_PEP_ID=MMETSP0419_2-20121207/24695_1 /TAXON_ID=582737 /ORGANISM="Tetraselmis sp., Strain GSL018" /LENGTH=301 /DNA_ID=CAMNT_0019115575 /DNA_START=112 /DNA_END=1017 /DNA_ORIENTATION=-
MRTSASEHQSVIQGLYGELEQLQTRQRVVKAAQKRPEFRLDEDVQAIMEIIGKLPLMQKHTPELQRDICYVTRLCTYDHGEAFSFPAELRGSGALCSVISGALHVRVPDKVPFGSMLWRGSKTGQGSKDGLPPPQAISPPAVPPVIIKDITTSELRSLFSAIDLDKNGGLSVDEMHHALETLGIDIGTQDLKDMMTHMDDDSSGEIDFGEFQRISWKLLEKRNGFGWSRVYCAGSSFGENSIVYGIPLVAEVMAEGRTEVLILDSDEYHAVLEGGFAGDLSKKAGPAGRPALPSPSTAPQS